MIGPRAVVPLGVVAALATGAGLWLHDGNRTLYECISYAGLERPAFDGTSVAWSWSRLDWVCVLSNSENGARIRTRAPLGWDLERRQPPSAR
jgi:hypothetical protein